MEDRRLFVSPTTAANSKPCQCHICERHKFLTGLFERLTDTDRKTLKEIIETLEVAEEEREYYYAILHNQWPGTTAIIIRENHS